MMSSTLLSGVFFPGQLDIGVRILEPEQVVFGVGGILRWLALVPLLAVREKGWPSKADQISSAVGGD